MKKVQVLMVIGASLLTFGCERPSFDEEIEKKETPKKDTSVVVVIPPQTPPQVNPPVVNPPIIPPVTPQETIPPVVIQPKITPPSESPWPYETIHQTTTPPGFTAIIPWAQTLQDTRQGNQTSTVEVDYLRLWAVVNGKNLLLCEDDYTTYDEQSKWFGIYLRTPWFGTVDEHSFMPSTYTSTGTLLVCPSTYPNNVMHWWDTQKPRPNTPNGAERFWVEMRVKITGPALVQIGADFYKTPTCEPIEKTTTGEIIRNVSEWGLSNWYGESPDWQIISVGTPGN